MSDEEQGMHTQGLETHGIQSNSADGNTDAARARAQAEKSAHKEERDRLQAALERHREEIRAQHQAQIKRPHHGAQNPLVTPQKYRSEPDKQNIPAAAVSAPAASATTSTGFIYALSDKVAVGDITILLSLKINNKLTITGLGDAGAITAPAIGQFIWIKVSVSGAVPTSATVMSGTPTWMPNPLEVNSAIPANPLQTAYNILIAEAVSTDDTRDGVTVGATGSVVKLLQRCTTSQLMVQVPVNGLVVWVATPWSHSTGI